MNFDKQTETVWKISPIYFKKDNYIFGEFYLKNYQDKQDISIKQVEKGNRPKIINFFPQYNIQEKTYSFLIKPINKIDTNNFYYYIENFYIYKGDQFIIDSNRKLVICNNKIDEIIKEINIEDIDSNFVKFILNYNLSIIKKILKERLKIKLELIDNKNVKQIVILKYNEIFNKRIAFYNLNDSTNYRINVYIKDFQNNLEFLNVSFDFTTPKRKYKYFNKKQNYFNNKIVGDNLIHNILTSFFKKI